jgi:hypothetical protein
MKAQILQLKVERKRMFRARTGARRLAMTAPSRWADRTIALCLGLVIVGCARQPLLDEGAASPPLVLASAPQAEIVDGRGRFREIFCALTKDHGAGLPDYRPCDQALHRLLDEAPPSGRAVNLGRSDAGLHLVIVPGLAAQCFGEQGTPLRLASRHVEQLGYEVSVINVDGLSSSQRNAAEIRDAIVRMDDQPGRPIVLLGYSKGGNDVLEAATDPAIAARVAAVVTLAGAINGSPLADKTPKALLELLAYLPGTDCKRGDGGALESLRRGRRMSWLASHRLSPAIRYYSLVSFTERGRVSALLRSAYDDLSQIDPRNDGQLIFYDQIVPGSTLLGYLNADHWAVAMPIARDHPIAASLLINHNAFPREILLEAILKYVEEDLRAIPPGEAAGRPRG